MSLICSGFAASLNAQLLPVQPSPTYAELQYRILPITIYCSVRYSSGTI